MWDVARHETIHDRTTPHTYRCVCTATCIGNAHYCDMLLQPSPDGGRKITEILWHKDSELRIDSESSFNRACKTAWEAWQRCRSSSWEYDIIYCFLSFPGLSQGRLFKRISNLNNSWDGWIYNWWCWITIAPETSLEVRVAADEVKFGNAAQSTISSHNLVKIV